MTVPRDLPAIDGREGWPWTAGPPRASPASAAGGPKISIVVLSYEQAEYLEETLRSVLLQDHEDLEVLVVDGGSTDGSVEILERYAPWLTWWVSEPDRGQSDAINKGFARAAGDLITFLSSDDVYEPGALAEIAAQWRQQPTCGAVIGAFRFMDRHSVREAHVHGPRLPGPGPHDLALMDTSLWRLHQVATFYTRHALDRVGRHVREELHYTMDRELLYRVCRQYPVRLTDLVVASFRRHPESKSVSKILPFMREMAHLHWLDAPADEAAADRRRRRALWSERMAHGYEKYARSGVARWRAARALVRAAFVRPSSVTRRRYLASWLMALGVWDSARSLRRALTGRRADAAGP